MNPSLSIIVPVYNVEEWLPDCIESVLAQTYNDWEMILVDDGSPDTCGRICDAYAEKDHRIKVIHRKNGGLSAARNSGLDVATGKYITFVDSDDKYACTKTLEMNVSILENSPDIDIVDFPYRQGKDGWTFGGKRTELVTLCTMAEKISSLSKYIIAFCAWNKIYRANVFDDVRFPEKMFTEDLWCDIDIMENSGKVMLSPFGLYEYNIREGSLMTSSMTFNKRHDQYKAYYRLMDKTFNTEGINAQVKAYVFFITLQKVIGLPGNDCEDLNLKAIVKDMEPYIPSLSVIFHKLEKQYKSDLIWIKLSGLEKFVNRRSLTISPRK